METTMEKLILRMVKPVVRLLERHLDIWVVRPDGSAEMICFSWEEELDDE